MSDATEEASPGPCLALYGGSFDPPHVAHVLVAAWAKSVAGVDGVLVVPAFAHAFGKRSAPFADRLALCEAAFADLPFVEVSPIESTLAAPSRTWRTLGALARSRPGARFRLVVGADVLAETSRWERWEDVAATAPPLVVGRAGHALPPGPCPVVLPDVSSTELRRRLARGDATEGWLPASVAEVIEARGLYRDTGAP
ncbi:MAG: nicotinate-nicotinamide nucleotide adenylyltransferase [Myxococcota bacterium]